MTTNAEIRLRDLGIRLPEVKAPLANFVPFVKTGKLVFVSGQVPLDEHGKLLTGQVGADISVEEAVAIARDVAITLIAVIKQAAGSLDNVTQIVKINGSVNAVPGFTQQPLVINGVSDLIAEVFGERGRHARAAVGTGSLPGNVPVEVEAIVEVA
jgi:enamine deaminase RidA (YjgF/YER057c/UK114 family)